MPITTARITVILKKPTQCPAIVLTGSSRHIPVPDVRLLYVAKKCGITGRKKKIDGNVMFLNKLQVSLRLIKAPMKQMRGGDGTVS